MTFPAACGRTRLHGWLALATLLAGCAADDIVVYRGRATHTAPDEAGGLPVEDASPAEHGNGGTTHASTGGATSHMTAGAGGSVEPMHPLPPPMMAGAGGGGGGSGGRQESAGGATGAGGAFPIGLGGIPNLPQLTCTTVADCPTNFMCAKIDCSQQMGFCQPRPVICPDLSPVPVCGCDGVTYWNDCIRQQNGVAASTLNQCTINAATCTTSADCKVPGASCARLNPVGGMESCAAPGLGACWVVPSDCATTPAAEMWVPCQGMNPAPTQRPSCVGTCDAIQSEQQHVAGTPGQMCR